MYHFLPFLAGKFCLILSDSELILVTEVFITSQQDLSNEMSMKPSEFRKCQLRWNIATIPNLLNLP